MKKPKPGLVFLFPFLGVGVGVGVTGCFSEWRNFSIDLFGRGGRFAYMRTVEGYGRAFPVGGSFALKIYPCRWLKMGLMVGL